MPRLEAMMGTVKSADGTSIHFEVEGSGPPLVLLHILGGSGRDWRTAGYVDALADSFRLILVDERGCGGSDKPHEPVDYRIERRVEDVVAVLDAVDVDRAHVAGYSRGGNLGFGMAMHAPERLLSFIVGGTHAYENDVRPMVERLGKGAKSFLETVELGAGTRLPEPMRTGFLNNDMDALIAGVLARGAESRWQDHLGEVAVPTLIYCGSDDAAHQLAQQSADLMPGAEFVTLVGLGHAGAFFDTEVVVPHIDRFLARVTDS